MSKLNASAMRDRRQRLLAAAGWTALLALILHPLGVMLFRLMIFDTLPRDDYAPMLLWWLGAPGAVPPISPYGYRALSMFAAVPFYHLLPPFALTNLPGNLTGEYVRATAALAAVSFVALTASAVMAYRLTVDRFGLGRPEAILAALFVLVAQLYASPFGVDPLAICVVVLALYFVERGSAFAVILIASVIVNEKVAILFVLWLTIRCVLRAEDRRLLGPQWLASVAAIVVYGALLAVVRLPGHGEQLEPGVYFPTLLQNVVASVTTTRGLVFNVVPCALLLGLVAWSWRSLGWQRHRIYSRLDLLVVPALAGVALILTQYFQVGRIVAHGAPLFIWPVAHAFGLWLRRRPGTE
jgi:hypothetical protein